jgi:FkbH-like protein
VSDISAQDVFQSKGRGPALQREGWRGVSSIELLPTAIGTARPSEYHSAARSVRNDEIDGLEPIDVAFLATATMDLVEPYLLVEGARRGFKIVPRFLPFNQLELQAMTADSELYAVHPDVVIVAWHIDELSPDIARRFLRQDVASLEAEVGRVESRVRGILTSIRARSAASLLVFNLAPPRHPAAGLADPGLEISQLTVVQRLNDRVAGACRQIADCHVVDYARAVLETGLRRWADLRLLRRGRIPFGTDGQIATGRLLARAIRAARKPPCKCLVLDLDNTLWGGVLGEDGAGGIRLGEDHPGNAFKEFQSALHSLRDRGILLAVASKNDERDALMVLDSHPDSLLRSEHFSAMRINWDDKANSLRAIAAELSIGLDALAFFDDSPIEREWIRSQLPEVNVIAVPESPIDYVDALFDSGAFDQLSISRDDTARAAMYAEDGARKALELRHESLDDFLRDLGLRATIGPVGPATLPRVTQLVAKTNQFNLTTRRHSAVDVARIANEGLGLWLRVSDRFGDAGLVGLALARLTSVNGEWELDTFLLSCRVIGRNVETALLATLCDAIRQRGGRVLRGRFIPTQRNAPAANFLPCHGFTHTTRGDEILDLTADIVRSPDYIAVELVNDGNG